jgi:signal peptidase
MDIRKTKFFTVAYYILLTALLFLVILFVGSLFPIPGNYKVMTVLSGSMEPDISVGSVVVSKPVGNYRIGDVITFQVNKENDVSVTHRIVEMEVISGNPIYITKGDANENIDTTKISQKDIIGKVFLNIPYLGYALNFVKKPIGFVLIIILPAGIIILDEARKIWKEVKNKKNKKKDIEKKITDENE